MTDPKSIHSCIHQCCLARRPSSMCEYIHPEIAMVQPGFKDTLRGRDFLVSSFEEFCKNARVIEYEEIDEHIDVVDDCAVATFRFRMLYELAAYREDCSGRDLWIFARQDGRWIAVWRAMLDLKAERTPMESPQAAARV